MTLADELAYTTLSSLSLRIRRRELSPVEVVDAFIERISARNPAVNAFVCEDFERSRMAVQLAHCTAFPSPSRTYSVQNPALR